MNILEVYSLSEAEIINCQFLFEISRIFLYSIYNSYTKIGFDSNNYNDEENKDYIKKICDLIMESKNLKKALIDKSKELMIRNINCLFEIIMKNEDYLREKLDLISLIKNYLSQEFQTCLTKIIFTVEKENMLEFLIHNKDEPEVFEIFEKLTIKTIENINNSENIIIKDRMGGNIVKKIFGFKIPHFKTIIELTMKNLEKYKNAIFAKEEEFRYSYEIDSEEAYEKICSELSEMKREINNEFIHSLRKIPEFAYYFEIDRNTNKKTQELIMTKFTKDFLFYYKTEKLSIDKIQKINEDENEQLQNNYIDLNNNNNIQKQTEESNIIHNSNIIEILEFLFETEFDSAKFTSDSFSKWFCFMMNYNDYIQKYLDIFLILRKYFKDYLAEIKAIIIRIKYPKTEETKFKEKVNSSNYKLVSAIINFLIEKFSKLNELSKQDFYDLMSEIRIVKEYLFTISYSLCLFNQSIKKLEIIDELRSFVIFEDKEFISEIFRKYSRLLIEESMLIAEKRVEDLILNFDEIYGLIDSNISPVLFKKKEINKHIIQKFNQFLIEFLIHKYRATDFPELKEKICLKILNDENLLNNSKAFIQMYFYYYYKNEYDIIPYIDPESFEGIPDEFGKFSEFGDKFMESIEKIIVEKNNQYLQHSITLIFEIFMTKFFDGLEKNIADKSLYSKNIREGTSLLYFKKAFKLWENISTANEEVKTPFLLKLYVITYMKLYVEKYLYLIVNYSKDLNFREVNKILSQESKKSTVLKLYILKTLKERYLKTWDKFNQFNFRKHNMKWKLTSIELNSKNNNETINHMSTLFLDLNQIQLYKEIEPFLQKILESKFELSGNDFFAKITNENFHVFIDLFINKVFSKISKGKPCKEEKVLVKFCDYMHKNILEKTNLRSKEKIALAFKNTIDFDVILNLAQQSEEVYETYFILFKHYILLLNSPSNSVYSYGNGNSFNEKFNDVFIPGNFDSGIQRLFSSYTSIKSINDIQDENNAWCIGCYLCSCETSYTLESCGSPVETSICGNCRKPTGSKPGIMHSLIEREGHLRVFKNAKHRETIIKTWPNEQDKDMAFKYTEDLKRDIDSRLINASAQFVQIPFNSVKDTSLTLPNISPFCFRILNLLQNCFFYFNYTNDFLTRENYVKFCADAENYYEDNQEKTFDCKQNIERNIHVLKNILERLNIKNLALLLNFILEKLVLENFYKFNQIATCKDKVQFETKLDALVSSIISPDSQQELNYESYHQRHSAEQKPFVDLDSDSPMILLDDEKNYMIVNKSEYPDFQFFKLKNLLTREQLTNKLEFIPNFENEFPILSNFLKFESKLKILSMINKLNPFLNEMIDRFSYKISRKDAKLEENSIHTLLELGKEKNKKLQDLFVDFQTAWKDIYTEFIKEPIQYECREQMEIKKEIKDTDPIAAVLNDDGEYLNGMYLAATYQYLAKVQNEFLEAVKSSIANNIRLLSLKKTFDNKLNIMKAKPFQVITLNKKKFSSFYDSFENLIFSNTRISLYNFSDFEFNFVEIENNLCELLIRGKKIFSNEQTFIKYTFESFRGENSDIIKKFSSMVEQSAIANDQKLSINAFLQPPKKGEKFISTLASMIFFLQNTSMKVLQNTSMKANIPLIEASEAIVKYIEIEKQMKEFFRKNLDFTLGKLVDIYNYTELIIYERIKENVSPSYKRPILEPKQKKLNEFYNENPNTLITRKNLATATRRFISRFLINEEEFRPDNELTSFLFLKEELWSKKVFNDVKFRAEEMRLMEIDIKISQSVDFYEFLGGDKEDIAINIEENIINVNQHVELDEQPIANGRKQPPRL